MGLPTPVSRRPAAVLVALLAAAAGAGCRGSGVKVAELELVDFSAPAMFERVAQELDRAYVLELPPGPVPGRFTLRLERTTEREVYDAIVRLDPSFVVDMRPGVSLMYPAGEGGARSPFMRKVESFAGDGGAATVVRDLLVASGLSTETVLQADAAGARRPVKLDAKDATVRDLLAQVAEQAHVAMRNEPGIVRMFAVPE